jgi:hypothetical protein
LTLVTQENRLLHFWLWLPKKTGFSTFHFGYASKQASPLFTLVTQENRLLHFSLWLPKKTFSKTKLWFLLCLHPPPQAHREFPKERHLLAFFELLIILHFLRALCMFVLFGMIWACLESWRSFCFFWGENCKHAFPEYVVIALIH